MIGNPDKVKNTIKFYEELRGKNESRTIIQEILADDQEMT
jgi:hypothetical protein